MLSLDSRAKPELTNPAAHWARMASMRSFMNALCRELPQWINLEQVQGKYPRLRLPLSAEEELIFSINSYSELGFHSYQSSVLYWSADAELQLSWEEAFPYILNGLGDQLGWPKHNQTAFAHRIQESQACITAIVSSLASSPPAQLKNFREAEQSLWLGHSLHPCPKSCQGWTLNDAQSYRPEYQKEFALCWWAVDRQRLWERRSQSFVDLDWLENLYTADHEQAELPAGEFHPFPLHPWQAKQLTQDPIIQACFARGELCILPQGRPGWTATASVRSLHHWSAPYQIKTSLSLRITNSLRHLSEQEIERGLALYDLMQSPVGAKFRRDFPYFTIMAEPAYAGICDDDGTPMSKTFVLCRENSPATTPNMLMLAALTQQDPLSSVNPLQSLISAAAQQRGWDLQRTALAWFDAFYRFALEPLLRAESDYGLLLGAHQQNLLLVIDDFFPKGACFRDAQGSGYRQEAWPMLLRYCPGLRNDLGNVLNQEKAWTLLSYYVVVNSCFGLIHALAHAAALSEALLLQRLRQYIQDLMASRRMYPGFAEYLLSSPTLPQKANLYTSYLGINEATDADPLRLYRPLVNPLAI